MANKRITDLTAVATVAAGDEFEIQKAGETTTKKATTTQITQIEATARELADAAIRYWTGVNGDGSFPAFTQAWYLRNADYVAGVIDRDGDTGVLGFGLYNGLRILDAKIFELSKDIVGLGIATVSVQVSTAEILLLNTLPKELLSVEATEVAEIISVYAYNNYNSTTYEAGANKLVIRYTGGNTIVELPNAFIEAAEDYYYRAVPPDSELIIGEGIELYCASNPTTGNGTWTIELTYRIHS